MRKNVLVSAAIAVVLMANVIFSVDAQAVSRTTTTELGGTGRSVEEAINLDPQLLQSADGKVDNDSFITQILNYVQHRCRFTVFKYLDAKVDEVLFITHHTALISLTGQ